MKRKINPFTRVMGGLQNLSTWAIPIKSYRLSKWTLIIHTYLLTITYQLLQMQYNREYVHLRFWFQPSLAVIRVAFFGLCTVTLLLSTMLAYLSFTYEGSIHSVWWIGRAAFHFILLSFWVNTFCAVYSSVSVLVEILLLLKNPKLPSHIACSPPIFTLFDCVFI